MLWFPTSDGGLVAIPWIARHNGNNDFFVDIGLRAIEWWKSFDPVNASPMDAVGNQA